MYIWLNNFEGTGKRVKVSLEALIKNNRHVTIGGMSRGKIKKQKIQEKEEINVFNKMEKK